MSEKSCKPKLGPFHLVTEGKQEVVYAGYEGPKVAFGSDEQRIYVHWEVVTPGRHQGLILFQSFKYYKEWGSQSKFYRAWSLANGGRPRRRTRMSPRIFAGKVFLAEVRTVRPIFTNGPLKGKEQPQCMWYSVVDELLEVLTGKKGEK